MCATWEANGANVRTRKAMKATIGVIEFEENSPEIRIFKDKKAKQFDPYVVEFGTGNLK